MRRVRSSSSHLIPATSSRLCPVTAKSSTIRRQTLRDEVFQQILDAVSHDSLFGLLLLGRRITPLELGCEYLLSSHPGLMKGDTPVRANRVFAQLRSSTSCPIEYDEDLP